jgi:hypothetical protein
VQPRERSFLIVILIAFIALIVVPYYFAWSSASAGRVFSGFLQNPIDGFSYLAKMRQGYEGSWLFALPYTADPGTGAPITLYYLFLGHAARSLHLPLILMFHLARVTGALLLGLSLFRFFKAIFKERWKFPFLLALFGSGLGWLAISFDYFTSDFWVAEAYPFLASYTNAHFPVGLALQVWLLTPLDQKKDFDRQQIAFTLVGSALLPLIFGFGWVIAFAVLTAWLAWQALQRVNFANELRRWLCVVLGGGPIVLYQFWNIQSHPTLTQWNAQNLTPAPPVPDLIISFSPAVLFAIWGVVMAWKTDGERFRFLVVWVIVCVSAIYLPLNLQRRLISGLFIPVAGLAAFVALKYWPKIKREQRILLGILLSLGAPTILLILLGGLQAATTKPASIYLSASELAAFEWLDEHAKPNALVMASPDSGLLIPAYSDARVFYGHPFETVNANENRQMVENFYGTEMTRQEAAEILNGEEVDYVLFGPREMSLGNLPDLTGWQVVFESGDVQIWTAVR